MIDEGEQPRGGRTGIAAAVVYVLALIVLGAAAGVRNELLPLVGVALLGGAGLLALLAIFQGSAGGGWKIVMAAFTLFMQLLVAAPLLFGAMLQNMTASPKGRLLRLNGRARVARPGFGDDWSPPISDPLTPVPPDSPVERLVAAEGWHTAARAEHASVPAFARLSLQLVALGAPSDLVEGAHRAALDEVDHARRCFALAAALGGVPWQPGPLPELADALADRRPPDLVRLARGSLRDGCLGEGVASEVAAALAETAEDPAVRALLERIAADEARHAELAWEVLAWCREQGGARVEEAIRAEAAGLDDHRAAAVPPMIPLSPARVHALGLPTPELAADCVTRVVASVRARVA